MRRIILISFLCNLWCCLSLRADGPQIETGVLSKLRMAPPGAYCSIVMSESPYYDADDKYYVAKSAFKDPNIDGLEVLKCFVETMHLTLDDAFGPDGETLLFPAVQFGHSELVKHLT